jgi:hypothetical protein
MRRFSQLVSILCLLALAACGRIPTAHGIAPAESPSPSSSVSSRVPVSQYLDCLRPGHNYELPGQGAPMPELIAVDRSCGQGRLQSATVAMKPGVSGSDAYARCLFCHNGQSTGRQMTEELAYYSAPTPASLPADCRPAPSTSMSAHCATAQATPWYEHTLVWFFVWKASCPPALGPGQYPEMSMTCVWFTVIDASTGTPGMLASG